MEKLSFGRNDGKKIKTFFKTNFTHEFFRKLNILMTRESTWFVLFGY